MTDLEKFKELYFSIGIMLKEENYPNGTSALLLGSDFNKKFGGTLGFYSRIEFDDTGKFLSQNFFE